MKRCYEKEHRLALSGEFDGFYHCGNGRTLSDGLRYCPQGGKLQGYFGWCACKELPKENEYEDLKNDVRRNTK